MEHVTHARDPAERPRVPVVLYDADCGFCTWVVDQMAARVASSALEIVPLQSPRADRLLGGRVDEDAKWDSWHLVEPDGSLYSGGDAVPRVLAYVPGGRTAGRLASRFPRVTEAAYRLVARNRGRIGRLVRADRCRTPGGQRD